MLSQLAVFSRGLLGCGGRRWRDGGKGREGTSDFLFPALDVTTLIIDLGKQQLRSFGIFLEYEQLIYFFNQGDRCQLGSEKRY